MRRAYARSSLLDPGSIEILSDIVADKAVARADRERKCIRQAMFLMVAIFIVSLTGLTYCGVLLPQTIFKTTHFAILTSASWVWRRLLPT